MKVLLINKEKANSDLEFASEILKNAVSLAFCQQSKKTCFTIKCVFYLSYLFRDKWSKEAIQNTHQAGC